MSVTTGGVIDGVDDTTKACLPTRARETIFERLVETDGEFFWGRVGRTSADRGTDAQFHNISMTLTCKG
jgi:hypothetical protein